jgi:Ring finger domain
MFKFKLKKSTPQPSASTERASTDPAPYLAPEDIISQPTTSSDVTSLRRRHGSRRHGTSQRSSSESSSSRSTNCIPPASKASIHGLIHLRLCATVPESLQEACLNEECVICTEAFCNNDVVTTLPCGHMHHADCIVDWLSRKCTCPTCRYEMPTDDKKFERRRARRQTRAVSPSQTDVATTTTATTTGTSTAAANFSTIPEDERNRLILQDLAAMVSMNRCGYFACHDDSNFNLILRRTLRVKEEIERKRTPLVAHNYKQDDVVGTKTEQKDEVYDIPTDTPIDHAHFLELHAGY